MGLVLHAYGMGVVMKATKVINAPCVDNIDEVRQLHEQLAREHKAKIEDAIKDFMLGLVRRLPELEQCIAELEAKDGSN